MAAIRKRGNSYLVMVSNGRDRNYKQIVETKTFRPDPSWSERRTEQELRRFVTEFEAEVKGGELFKKNKMFFSELVDKWFSEYVKTNLSVNTQNNYRDVLKNHLLPALEKYRLHDLTSFKLQSFLNSYYEDAELERKEISISKSAGYHNKVLIIKEPKTRGSIRTVAMPESVMKLLAHHKREQEKEAERLEGYWQKHNFVFTQDNGKMMYQSTPYIAFKNAIARYNEAQTEESMKLPNIPLHGLRHTSATIMLSNNANISAVAARLGHSQTSTTLNVYAHAVKSADYENSNILDSVLKLK